MGETYSVRPPADEQELSLLIRIIAPIFDITEEYADKWIQLTTPDQFRLIWQENICVGGMLLLPMGQFFGGRSVPMIGAAALGIAPEYRGGGAASSLMTDVLRELHDQGCPLSTLYPATQPVYRRAGFEQAGGHFQVSVPLDSIGRMDHACNLRAIKPEDEARVKLLYRDSICNQNGPLDRCEYMWQRVRYPRFKTADGYIVETNGIAEGYIYLNRISRDDYPYDLNITDVVALTENAGRAVWKFLSNHRSMAKNALLRLSHNDHLLALLPEQHYDIKLHTHWMLRIVHVKAALEARGYPPNMTAELHFKIHDKTITQNECRYILNVEGGCGSITEGGRGDIELDVRGLAALYAGHRDAQQLRAAGLFHADDEPVALASMVFAGPDSWMPDTF